MKFFKPKFWDKNQISLFVIFLFPLTLLFKLLSFSKKLFLKKQNYSIPVICVGNIYLGGTGKTPFCIKLFSILEKLNKNPAFIRKKYDSFKDEINLLKNIGPTYENEKRMYALNEAIKNKAEIAILDDGFQDFSVKKNLSIICFNEKQWIGNGFVIPSGPLREELSALKRANCVIINGKKNDVIEKKILENNSSVKIFYTKYKPKNIEDFKNKRVLGFAGIGNPDNFFELLRENKINILNQINFPDHHNYTNAELENLIKKSEEIKAVLVTTEKDFVRINETYKKNIKHLKIEVEIENHNQFVEELKKFI